jgi:hypothetical protein
VIGDCVGDPGCGTACGDRSAVTVCHVADVVIPEFDDERAVLALSFVLCILSVFADDRDGLNGGAVRKYSGGEFFCQFFCFVCSPSWLRSSWAAAEPFGGLHDAQVQRSGLGCEVGCGEKEDNEDGLADGQGAFFSSLTLGAL